MKTIRFASLAKARELFTSGGTVVNIGSFPEASEKGRGNREFDALRSGLFGNGAEGRSTVTLLRTNQHNGKVYQCDDKDSIVALVTGLFPRDFAVVDPHLLGPPLPLWETGKGVRVMHRRIGNCDVYAVYNVPQGTECFFRSKGKVELWNPWTGDRRPLLVARTSDNGTTLPLPLSRHDIQLVVFSPGKNDAHVESSTLSAIDSVKMVNGSLMLWGEGKMAGAAEAEVKYQGRMHKLVGEVRSVQATKPSNGRMGV